ncbi:MAG: hypothetical protein HC892_23015 [Saprospiraceae bacterium]|nr:hypothetical protein [Saprospiraceae bacterium]
MMKDALKQYIMDRVAYPNKEELDEVLELFQLKIFSERRIFKRPFATGSHVGFVQEGSREDDALQR